MENKIEHLKMIEKIIERMAKNSFQLKGWAMTLVTLVGALSANDADKRFIILAFIPIIVFWLLDSFYLQQERRYRALYRETIPERRCYAYGRNTFNQHILTNVKNVSRRRHCSDSGRCAFFCLQSHQGRSFQDGTHRYCYSDKPQILRRVVRQTRNLT